MKSPKSFQTILIDEASARLENLRFQIVQGGVGTGKTLMGMHIGRVWLSKNPKRRLLIVAPRVTLTQWYDEADDQGVHARLYHGINRKESGLDSGVCLTTIQTLHSSIRDDKIKFGESNKHLLLIIDEIDELRNMLKHTADETRRAGKRCETIGQFLGYIQGNEGAVLGLTATPARDSYQDMLTYAWIAGKSTHSKFAFDPDCWAPSADKSGKAKRDTFVDEFICLARSPEYPIFTFVERSVSWELNEILAYRDVAEKLLIAADKLQNHRVSRKRTPEWRSILHTLQEYYYGWLIRLERTMLHPIFAKEKGKLTKALISCAANSPSSRMLCVSSDLQNDPILSDKVLILGKHSEPLRVLSQHIRNSTGRPVYEHYGIGSSSERIKQVAEFRNSKASVLVATWDSFGVGLSLPESNIVYWFNTPKSPGTLLQGNGRVRRPLVQKTHVWHCYYLYAGKLSLDECILAQHTSRVRKMSAESWLQDGDLGSMPQTSERHLGVRRACIGALLPAELSPESRSEFIKRQKQILESETIAMKKEDVRYCFNIP